MPSKNSSIMSIRIPNDIKEDLERMLRMSGTSLAKVVVDLYGKWSSGEINISDNKIVIQDQDNMDLDMKTFLEACDDKRINPQDAINKMTQMIWRGSA